MENILSVVLWKDAVDVMYFSGVMKTYRSFDKLPRTVMQFISRNIALKEV